MSKPFHAEFHAGWLGQLLVLDVAGDDELWAALVAAARALGPTVLQRARQLEEREPVDRLRGVLDALIEFAREADEDARRSDARTAARALVKRLPPPQPEQSTAIYHRKSTGEAIPINVVTGDASRRMDVRRLEGAPAPRPEKPTLRFTGEIVRQGKHRYHLVEAAGAAARISTAQVKALRAARAGEKVYYDKDKQARKRLRKWLAANLGTDDPDAITIENLPEK